MRTTVDSWDRIDDPDNIEFVVDDVRGRTRFADNTFDVVHIRQMRLTVRPRHYFRRFPH
jgi:hypothetical protein